MMSASNSTFPDPLFLNLNLIAWQDCNFLDFIETLLSHFSLMAGKKRGSGEIRESLDLEPKRVKYRDLESVFRSEGVNLYNVKYWKNKQGSDLAHSDEKEVSQVTENTVNSDASKSGKMGRDRGQVLASPAIISPDRNANVKMSSGFAGGIAQTSFEDTTRRVLDSINIKSSREINLQRDPEDVSSSVCCGPLNTDKYNDQLKSRDASGCGSTGNPQVEKDPMKVWKEMKQNGFMSIHRSAPVPNPRTKKSKDDAIKKRQDVSRRDQVDRFSKIAAPSGLLNGLNPGIINNLRNSRQVRSKIEALVRSASYEEDRPALKQSSSASMALENVSSMSNEESSNQATVSNLSLKAANVASEWLELLHQDIKGRLAALQHSKNRVQCVIETGLPLLLSRELSSNKENAPHPTNLSVPGPSDDLHKARWSALFDQMNNKLNKEEKQLESWLSQVNAMQLHCGNGLFDSTKASGMQQLGTSEIVSRLYKGSDLQKGLEVRAAAAAFYSTCTFLQSPANLDSF
ncbi:hypothetical protein POM88_042297 [Heracleum sosnowskyi]|uniref:Uncharacterized protein n=1 Tax=Heracleum sosnowskyi TaxID=360622 RepID=A0AAD8MAI9_9APIA|nr:hypothetical protein POM88_042297 [Heracleum sosnowskyi]